MKPFSVVANSFVAVVFLLNQNTIIATDKWRKENNSFCELSNTYKSYDNLLSAKVACSSDNQCIGIEELFHDKKTDYFLCKNGFTSSYLYTSVFHRKATPYDRRGGDLVCLDVRLTSLLTTNERYGWELGSCSFKRAYVTDQSYTEVCCLPRVEHTLTCNSFDGVAWAKIFLLINGHRFCDDFTGYKAMRRINISALIAETSGNTMSYSTEGNNTGEIFPSHLECEKGWSRHHNSCLKFVGTSASWITAKDNCAHLNSNLPSIHSTDKISYITKLTVSSTLRGFWVGGTLGADESSFVWVDGSMFDLDKWAQNERTWGGSCIQVRGDLKWSYFPCKEKLPYICEKPLSVETDVVVMDLIPRQPLVGCVKESIKRTKYTKSSKVQRPDFSTCSCEDHCRWDMCRLKYPPEKCLFGTSSKWTWDLRENAWIAQRSSGCMCKDMSTADGYGNCQKDLGCYVEQPSSCNDLELSYTIPGEKWSYQACSQKACTPDNCCGSATGWREAWADMLPDQQKMWTTLGWKNVTWDDSIDSLVPREHLFCWENATKVQLNAASSLCYTRDSWDGDVARRYQVICDQRIDEIDEQRAAIFMALFDLKNISSQTTKSPPIPLATIKIPKVIGEREKKAHKKLQAIDLTNDAVKIAIVILFGAGLVLYFFHSLKQVMANPKVIKRCSKVLFTIACFLLATYMTNTQIMRFLKNEDSTTIAFKRFNLSPEDKYPTFSICLTGAELRWYNEKNIFDTFGVSSLKYQKMLKGQKIWKYDYDYKSKLYSKIPVDYIAGSSADKVDKFSISVSDILIGLHYSTSPNEKSLRYMNDKKGSQSEISQLKLGYQTPNKVCFTRSTNDSLDTVRRYDRLDFDGSIFGNQKYQNVGFEIFIHYPQQLLRSLNRPVFKSTVGGRKVSGRNFWRHLLRITISENTVLRKRSGSNVPCDPGLVDDDVKLQTQIAKSIQCIPIYWNSVFKTELSLETCNSSTDLKKAYQLIKYHTRVFRTYDPPCIKMKISTRFDKEEIHRGKGTARILFKYYEENYQEIMTTKNFGFESFVSGVGGFVGIFLGYSILQLPEIFTLLRSFTVILKKYQPSGGSIIQIVSVTKEFCICWKKRSRQRQVVEKEELKANKSTSYQTDLKQVPSNDQAIEVFTDTEDLGISIDPTEHGEKTVHSGAESYLNDLISDLTLHSRVKQS